MGKFYAFVLGMVAGFGLYHLASSYHLVRTDSGIHWAPKVNQSLEETYVDIRDFGPGDWVEHPALAAAIAQSGDKELIDGAAAGAVDNAIEKVLPKQQDPVEAPE